MGEANIDEFRKRAARVQRKRRGFRLLPFGRGSGQFAGGLRIPTSQIGIVLAMALAIKTLILIEFGENRYRARLASYDEGSVVEKIGVFVMQPGPLSLRVRDFATKVVY